MSLQSDFEKAAADVKSLPSKPSDDELLTLYGFYKQATEGDAQDSQAPSFWDLKGKAKFGAWKKNAGMSKDDAMRKYIETVNALKAKYA